MPAQESSSAQCHKILRLTIMSTTQVLSVYINRFGAQIQ